MFKIVLYNFLSNHTRLPDGEADGIESPLIRQEKQARKQDLLLLRILYIII